MSNFALGLGFGVALMVLLISQNALLRAIIYIEGAANPRPASLIVNCKLQSDGRFACLPVARHDH